MVNGSKIDAIKGWVQLSRPPFHLVGLLPFVLGALLAWKAYGTFNWPVLAWSTLAVVLIMLSTYYSGEFYDYEVDALSARMERNAFSGGTQVILKNLLPRGHAKIAAFVTIILAGFIGLVLHFYYRTGPWTIPLGIVGIIAGFFYSTPPVRWVKRGLGELIIAYCYGWLPVATAFYLQTGTIDAVVHLVSIPIAATIFNVILINEFPDYPADIIEDKRNLVVRLGKPFSAFLYVAATIIALITFPVALMQGVPFAAIYFYIPVFLISLLLIFLMLKKSYVDRKRLELICGLTIVVNMGTSLAYTLALLLKNTI